MSKIASFISNHHDKIDKMDLDLIIAHVIKKNREFVLSHPEFAVNSKQETVIKKLIQRRIKREPLAYILGQKEFFGLNFKVDKHTLIPRPETELLVEETLREIKSNKHKTTSIIDIGTGSGNIIISLAKNIWTSNVQKRHSMSLYGTDISEEALHVAKQNAHFHKVDKKIKFIQSDLLKYFFDHSSLLTENCVILANLPYLSEKIYNSTSPDVKNYEPKSALLSKNAGLSHYEKLLKQIKLLVTNYELRITIFLEFSPEQKDKLERLIKKHFPEAKRVFKKDLASKWRMAEIHIK